MRCNTCAKCDVKLIFIEHVGFREACMAIIARACDLSLTFENRRKNQQQQKRENKEKIMHATSKAKAFHN